MKVASVNSRSSIRVCAVGGWVFVCKIEVTLLGDVRGVYGYGQFLANTSAETRLKRQQASSLSKATPKKYRIRRTLARYQSMDE